MIFFASSKKAESFSFHFWLTTFTANEMKLQRALAGFNEILMSVVMSAAAEDGENLC